MNLDVPYTSPQQASFWQKLGPGGFASLLLAMLSSLLLFPVLLRVRRVLRESVGAIPAPSDLILVLGRRLEADRPTAVFEGRLAFAEDLWRGGLSSRILVAGGITGKASLSEAEAGQAWLLARGVPLEALLLEDHSQHTLENLFLVRERMQEQGWRSLLLVSDPLHLARAGALAAGLRMNFCCIAANGCPPRRGSLGWWARVLSESFYLHWYATGMWYSRLIRSDRQLARVT
jgi:vancomycin permeability regulator SanA